MQPKTMILSGYGLNCEEETKYAFELSGAVADIIHPSDLIRNKKLFANYQIMAFPGGFSFGDDTGSGNAYANKIKNHLWEELLKFISQDRLVIGICNGFQILTNLGLLPGLDKVYGEKQVALMYNDSARYSVRFVDMEIQNNSSPWLHGLKNLSLPVAHGEGKFYAPPEILKNLKKKKLIALKYTSGETSEYLSLPPNPNGSLENIAGITDETGRIIGMMPHPERAIFFHQMPYYQYLKEKSKRSNKSIPEEGPGLRIFKNAVNYFN